MKPYEVANGPYSPMYPNKEEVNRVYGMFRVVGKPIPLMTISRCTNIRVSRVRFALKSLSRQGKIAMYDRRGDRWIRWE